MPTLCGTPWTNLPPYSCSSNTIYQYSTTLLWTNRRHHFYPSPPFSSSTTRCKNSTLFKERSNHQWSESALELVQPTELMSGTVLAAERVQNSGLSGRATLLAHRTSRRKTWHWSNRRKLYQTCRIRNCGTFRSHMCPLHIHAALLVQITSISLQNIAGRRTSVGSLEGVGKLVGRVGQGFSEGKIFLYKPELGVWCDRFCPAPLIPLRYLLRQKPQRSATFRRRPIQGVRLVLAIRLALPKRVRRFPSAHRRRRLASQRLLGSCYWGRQQCNAFTGLRAYFSTGR